MNELTDSYAMGKIRKANHEQILEASVEITYKNPLTKLNEVSTFDIPVPIHYTYIAKTLNWSAIVLILLVIVPHLDSQETQ
jgi:hypothetical protein